MPPSLRPPERGQPQEGGGRGKRCRPLRVPPGLCRTLSLQPGKPSSVSVLASRRKNLHTAPMSWSWNKLAAAKWEDAWSERIAGNPNAVITKIKGGKTVRITVYCDHEEDALTLKEYFGGTVREIKTRDWVAAQNREKRPPLKIRNSLIITEQSSAEKLAALRRQFPGRRILSVPAEMAFGTGGHATTSTCLRFIADFAQARRGTAWSITDIGCGTAVLAIAALKLGAEHATAFDFDPMAVEVARHNMGRNAVTAEQLDLFTEDVFKWTPAARQKGDLVAANLFSTILQRAFPQIIAAMKKDAVLIISGILASQWEETKAAAERHGLSFDRVVKRGKWITAKGGMAR